MRIEGGLTSFTPRSSNNTSIIQDEAPPPEKPTQEELKKLWESCDSSKRKEINPNPFQKKPRKLG
jgi:hypothetical protein